MKNTISKNSMETYYEKAAKSAEKKTKKLEELPIRLRRLRRKEDPNSSIPEPFTLNKLSDILGDNYSNMARYEAYGKKYVTRPPFEVLIKLSAIYQVSIDYILYGDNYTSASSKEAEAEKVLECQGEIEALKKTLKDKEELVNSQKMVIDMIMKEKN